MIYVFYYIREGLITFNGKSLGVGYSGNGVGRNNPSKTNVRAVGPIPVGKWVVGPGFQHPHLGPLSLPLTPVDPRNALGRSGFFVHGDNPKGDGSASEGCIVISRPVRNKLDMLTKESQVILVVLP
jgi:Protein of unknown function (DUF2778)